MLQSSANLPSLPRPVQSSRNSGSPGFSQRCKARAAAVIFLQVLEGNRLHGFKVLKMVLEMGSIAYKTSFSSTDAGDETSLEGIHPMRVVMAKLLASVGESTTG